MAAVVALAASPAQVGILAALVRGPGLLVGLFGGGFIDRSRRRPILIGADVGRALVLGSVPAAAAMHLLGIAHIYIAGALVGALSVMFDIADHAYLPGLIARDQLVDGNAKLAATESVAEIGGPSVAGVLFQVFTAPIAIAANAATYLVSAFFLMGIRRAEPPPPPPGPPQHPLADFNAGLAIAMAHPLVRPLLLMSVFSALFGAFYSALYTIFAIRTLGLTTTMLGLTVSVGGVGAMIGAALAAPLIRRLGIGRAMLFTWLATSASSLFIPFAHGSAIMGMIFLMVSQLLGDSLGTVVEIAGRTLRQSALPLDVMGRVGAVFAAAAGATGVVGALLGGWLGVTLGPRETLLVASGGLIIAPLIGLFSPLRNQREVPAEIG
jgi:predicted MFS family arabinose efflux permease